MTAYIPAPIRERVSALNDNYNPLAAANRPSIAHGKYLYVMGMAYQNYGEATQSMSWAASGTQLKAEGMAEMQAARMGASAGEFAEMLRTGDERIFGGEGGKVLGEGAKVVGGVAAGTGKVLGEGVKGGETVVKGGKSVGDAGVGVGEKGVEVGQRAGKVGLRGVEGVTSGVTRGGQTAVDGLGKGGEAVGRSTGLSGLWGRK